MSSTVTTLGVARGVATRRPTAVRAAPPARPLTSRALLRAFHRTGERATRDRIVAEYMPLVVALARRYSGRGEGLDDLIQVGSIGLIKAIDRFDPGRGLEFTTYAVPTIVGEIKRHFRDKVGGMRVPRRLKELHLRISSVTNELTTSLGRAPTIPELAFAAGVTEPEVAEALEVASAFRLLSLSAGAENEDGDEVSLIDLIGDDEPAYRTADNRLLLRTGLRRLEGRERAILHMRFYAGLTQSEIAAEVGISQMHVSRMIRKSLASLADSLEAA